MTTNYGLNDHLIYYEIFLDSYDCIAAADSSYLKTDWPMFQLTTPIPNLAAIKILEVQIPFSFYIFNSSNNTFLLTDTYVTNAVVTIPVGNYNSTTLAAQLAASLMSASPAVTYTVTFSGSSSQPNTGKFTISNNTGSTSVFSLIFGTTGDLGLTNPRLFLGFPAGTTTSGTNQVLNAPYAANIAGPNYLYLNSRTFGTTISTVLPGGAVSLGAGSIGPQIAKIPINVQPGGVIYWMDVDPQKWFSLENLPLLTQFDMYITIGNNATPTVTSLNGLNFSVKMGLLRNKMQIDQLQGQGGMYPASSLSMPRGRVRY